MERDLKVLDTATLLLERYGRNAPEIARGWSRELMERREPKAAARCLEIVDAVNKMLADREPLPIKAKRRRRRSDAA
jgi:hypothetical protein